MADTTFSSGTVIQPAWLNDVNDVVYTDVGGVGGLSNTTDADKGDDLLGVKRTDTGAVATTLHNWIEQKELNLKGDFGAVGDGSANDATPLQAAVTAGGGRVIEGNGKTYKINSVITGITSGTIFRNMTLDFSGISTTSAIYLSGTGTKGSSVALTSNLSTTSVTVAVGSTASFSDEQWVWLESTAIWATVDSTVYGQYAKIKSIDSATQITLYAPPIVPFNTADSASISPVTPLTGVIFDNVTIIGSGANTQVAIKLSYGLDCHVKNTCKITDTDYVGTFLYRCINTKAAPTVLRARAVGLAYGVSISGGCYGCATEHGYGEDLRHYVTVGDNDGINMSCRANYNVVMASTSAGIDSHAASADFECIGNDITLAFGSGSEGITLQGLNPKCSNNYIRNVTGIGIYGQPLVTATGYRNKASITGNHIFIANGAASTIGVYIQTTSANASSWDAAEVSGNIFYEGGSTTNTIHTYVLCNDAKEINNVTIRGNISVDAASGQGVYVRALATSSSIENVIISDNIIRTSGSRCVYILAGGTSSTIDNVIITGNRIIGGSTANISIIGNAGTVTSVVEDNNLFSGGGDLFEVSGTATTLKLKSTKYVPGVSVTTGTYTLDKDTDTFTFNNAGTVTVTLPSAADYPARELFFRTIQAQVVNSASSNVEPNTSTTAGTAILPATDGAWAILKSNGTNWVVVAQGV